MFELKTKIKDKKIIFKFLIYIFSFWFLIFGLGLILNLFPVQAQTASSCPSGKICIPNPLKYASFEDLIRAVIETLFWLTLAVTPLIFVAAGYLFITSGGKPEQVNQAKDLILYALIGLLIIFLSGAFLALIKEVF